MRQAVIGATLRALLGVIALGGLVVACGEDPSDAAQSPQGVPARSASDKQLDAVAEATKGMVKGVTNPNKPGAPVDLKFELKARPESGQPLAIDVALLPQARTDSLRATYLAPDGLLITPSKEPAEYANVEARSVHRHTITVTPREDGVYYLSAIVVMNIDGTAEVRTFNIPVLVGALPDLEPVRPAQPMAGATGEAAPPSAVAK